jgi:hypothetical protein
VVAVKLPFFGGMRPAQDDNLLPVTAAALSENTWLYSGALRGMNEPEFIRDCATSSTARSFRIPNNYLDSEHIADADWLDFEDPDTDVIRAPVNDDSFDRYYWVSPSQQARYNTRERIADSDPPWLLGIPTPSGAPSVVPSGGASGTTETRAYVYTWVSAYGEEGAPSPPTTVTGKIDDTWAVTLSAAAAGDLGVNRNLTKVRIYRTVTAVGGTTTFFFVVEQDITDTTYNDTIASSVVGGAAQLQSTNWTPPPTDLEGWVVMPNGMVAGWRNQEVWFCEPYRPHAWPAIYTMTVDYPVMGLGVIGQTLVVCTQGNPVALTGVNPSAVTEARLSSFEPCTSRGSIISSPTGVYYTSPNGLILVSNNGAVNVTRTLVTKDKWSQLVPLATLRAAMIGDGYYAFGSARFGVFTDAFEPTAFAQEDFSGAFDGVLIDPTNEVVAFNTLTTEVASSNNFNDAWSSDLLLIRDGKVYRVDVTDPNPTFEPCKWRSKIFQTNNEKNLAAYRVYFDVPPTAPALNPVRNTNLVQTLQADQWGLIRVYADGVLKVTRELRTSGEIMRIPSGFKADYWQFEFETRVKVKSLQVASSVKELLKV